ncbi:MAG: asparagine synthase-related protein [Elusimicrobiota bacterium]
MTDILFAVSRSPLSAPAGLRCLEARGRFFYWTGNAFENAGYVVLLYGDLYGDAVTPESVIAAYERHGESCFDGLDGDFSIILYDKAADRVVAGRDKFGVKSLFYVQEDGLFAASNRAAALAALRPQAVRPNLRRNLFYVASHYRHIDAAAEETFYEGVFAVRQGCALVFQNWTLSKSAYWRLGLMDLSGKDKACLADDFRGLLRDSVARRLSRSKNPVFMVSSGVDSSGVAALASAILGRKVPLITTVFEEDTEYNEAAEIVPLADKVASVWHKLTVKGDGILGDVERILQTANGPYYTITQLMHYYLCREARERGYDSVFGGLGGDEASCGEIEEYLFYFADLRLRGERERLAEDMKGWIEYHSHPLYPKSMEVLEAFFKKHIDFSRPGRYRLDMERFERYFHVFRKDFREAYFRVPELDFPYASYLRNKLHQDLFSEVIPCVLRAEENNLDLFGLAGRLPYMDARVMTYGFSIPLSQKYVHGGTKAVAREAMKGILPDAVLNNFKKKGWNAPFDAWLKTYLSGSVADILGSPTARQRSIYDLEAVRRLWDEHLNGRKNHMLFFWQFLNYEKWFSMKFPGS